MNQKGQTWVLTDAQTHISSGFKNGTNYTIGAGTITHSNNTKGGVLEFHT